MIKILTSVEKARNLACAFALTLDVLLLSLDAKSADLWDVMPDQATFSSKSADFSITIKMDDESRLSELVFRYHGKVFSVPKSELEDIRIPFLGSLRLKSTDPNSSPKVLDLNQEDIAIVVEYGTAVSRNWYPDGREITENQRSCVHFIFNTNGYQYRSRSLVQEGLVKCKLFFKEVGEGETEEGFSTNDYPPDDPPFLLCKSVGNIRGQSLSQKSANSKGSPSVKGESPNNSRSAPRLPESPPPAKPGSAP